MSHHFRSGFKHALHIFPVVLFIIVLVLSGYTSYHFATHIVDSDFSSELVLGHFLAEQNKIVSSDWFYGSELRLFNTNLIYMPLFKITDNWIAVRFASTIILQIILVLSYFYLSKQLRFSANTFFLTASLLLLPLNASYGILILYQSYYIPSTAYGFLIVGLFLSIVRNRGDGRRLSQGLRLFAMLGLSLISCMNGARQIPATMITLPIAALLVAAKSQGKRAALSGVDRKQWSNIGLAFSVSLAGGVGFLVHNAVLSRYFTFHSTAGSKIMLPILEGILNILRGYLYQFGFQENRPVFSVEGILTLASIFAALVFLALAVHKLAERTDPDQPYATSLILNYYPAALFVMVFIFFFISGFVSYSSYLIMVTVWLIPMIGAMFNHVHFKELSFRRALALIACLCLFANGFYYNFFYLHPEGKPTQYCKLTQMPIDELDRLQGVLNFLEENEYQVGYATHWQANVITEATNGKIPMIRIIRVYPYPIFAYDDCLTYKQTRELSFVEDKDLFMLLTNDEADIFSNSDIAAYGIPVYQDDSYTILTFDFTTEVWDYLLAQAEYLLQDTVLDQLAGEGGRT